MTAGTPPKPPAGKPAPAAPVARPAPAAPVVKPATAVTPKAAPVAPVAAAPKADALSREEIRGIAQAIARNEASNLRDDLVARLTRIEERIGALEKRPLTPPAPAVAPPPIPVAAPPPIPVAAPVAFAPIVPAFASVPAPAPVAVVAVAPRASLPPPAALAPMIEVPIHVDDTDLPFVSGARRRKRIAWVLIVLLIATVGTIVVTAMISQAMNSHS